MSDCQPIENINNYENGKRRAEFRMLFGGWYQKQRKISGKTIKQIEYLTGVSRGNLSEMENGKCGPTFLRALILR